MENKDQQKQIDDLKRELEELKRVVFKGRFSDKFVFDTPVTFRRPNSYTAAGGTIASGTSAGKIEVKIAGVSKYIPYFN